MVRPRSIDLSDMRTMSIANERHALVVGLQGLGNLLLSAPLIEAMTADLGMTVTVLVPDRAAAELMATSGAREVVVASAQSRWRLVRRLRSRRFDIAVVAYPGGPRSMAVAWASGARCRVGHVGRVGWVARLLLTDSLAAVPGRHDVEHNHDLAVRLGAERVPIPTSGPSGLRLAEAVGNEDAERWLDAQGLRHLQLIGIAPGGGRRQAFKRWPLERYMGLASQWREVRPEHGVLWFLGPDEADLRDRLTEQSRVAGRAAVVEGLSISTVAALLRHCRAVVANDNGLMHLASIQGVPVVGVFGPTDPGRTRPFWQPHTVVHLDLPCRPCYSAARRRFRCTNPQGMACLLALGEAEVLTALHALTSGKT